MPYRGRNNEIPEGKKTKISLYKDRIEYIVEYTENVKITISNDENSESHENVSYNKEEGVLDRASVLGLVKYIKTDYTEELEPYTIHYLDICSSANSLTFSLEYEKDKDSLYRDIYDWKYKQTI